MTTVINLRPLSVDLDMYSGDEKTIQLRLWADPEHTIPVVTTGLTFTAQLRKERKSPDGAKWNLPVTVTVGTPTYLDIRFPKEVTSVAPLACVWDLQYINTDGQPTTLLTGNVEFVKDVTR